MQRFISFYDAKPDSPWKLVVEQQEIHDLVRRYPTMSLAVHLKRAGRAQYRSPLNVVKRSANIEDGWKQDEVLHVQNTRRLVRSLQHPAQVNKAPSFTVRHGSVGDAGKQMAGLLDRGQEIVQLLNCPAVSGFFNDCQVEFVNLLPHLTGNDLPHRTGVLTSRARAGDDRVQIRAIESEEFDDILARRRPVTFGKNVLIARRADQRV